MGVAVATPGTAWLTGMAQTISAPITAAEVSAAVVIAKVTKMAVRGAAAAAKMSAPQADVTGVAAAAVMPGAAWFTGIAQVVRAFATAAEASAAVRMAEVTKLAVAAGTVEMMTTIAENGTVMA